MDRLTEWARGVARELGDPQLAAVCFAFATLPVEISGLWFPTTLVNLSRIGMAVAILLAALRALRNRREVRPLALSLVVGTGAVLAIDLLSTAVTRWPGAIRDIGPFVFYAAFAAAVAQTLTDGRRVRVAAAVFLVAALAESVLLIIQQVGDFYLTEIRNYHGRRNGTFIDPNIAARYLLVGLVVALAAVRDRAGWRTPVVIALPAVISMAIVLTFSRSGWAILVLVALASLALDARLPRVRVAAIATVATFVLGILLIPNALQRATDPPTPADSGTGAQSALLVSYVASPAAPAATPIADVRQSTPLDGLLNAAPIDRVRRYLARAGVAMFLDHPLAGVGFDGFGPEIRGPYAGFILPDYRSAPVTAAHTDVIRIAAEEGLLGLAALAAFVAVVLLALRRGLASADRLTIVGLQAAGLGALVVGLAAQFEGRFYGDAGLWVSIGVIAALASVPRGTVGRTAAGPVAGPVAGTGTADA